MTSDVNLELNNYLDRFFQDIMEEVDGQQQVELQSLAQQNLSCQEIVIQLEMKLDLIHQQIHHFPHREYWDLINDRENLAHVFLGRLLFCQQEENIHLREAFRLNETEKFMTRHLIQYITLLPASTQPEAAESQQPLPNHWLLYVTIFNQAYQMGLTEGQKIIAEFKMNNPSWGRWGKQYRSTVKERLDRHWIEFHEFEDLQLCYLMKDKDALKCYFVEKCSQRIDVESYARELQKVVAWKTRNEFLTRELEMMDQKVVQKAIDIISCFKIPLDILCRMVPDAQIIGEMKDLMDKIKQDLNFGKPALMIKKDEEYAFKHLFQKAYGKVQVLLANQPADRKYIYIKYMRRDLNAKKNKAKEQGKVFCQYYQLLIDSFDDEWEYVKNVDIQHHLSFDDILHERQMPQKLKETQGPQKMKKLKHDTTKPMAFNYKKTMNDNLYAVLDALILLGAISKYVTLPQFRALFNGQEVLIPLEWLGDQGDLMAFIKEAVMVSGRGFAPYNQHWKIAVKCFVPKGGTERFDPQKLRCSKPTSMEQKFIETARKLK